MLLVGMPIFEGWISVMMWTLYVPSLQVLCSFAVQKHSNIFEVHHFCESMVILNKRFNLVSFVLPQYTYIFHVDQLKKILINVYKKYKNTHKQLPICIIINNRY